MISQGIFFLAALLCLMLALPGGQAECPSGQTASTTVAICVMESGTSICTGLNNTPLPSTILSVSGFLAIPQGSTCSLTSTGGTITAIGSAMTCFGTVSFCVDVSVGVGVIIRAGLRI